MVNEKKDLNFYNNFIFKILVGISNFLLVLMTCLVSLEVIGRYFFNTSFIFVTPMTGVLFPWLVFLAIMGVTKNNNHISVNYFRDKLPFKAKKIVIIFNKLVMLFFCIFMLLSSYDLSTSVLHVMAPIINVSKFWLYSSMIVAFGGSSIVILVQLFLIIAKNGVREVEGDSNDLGNDI